MQHGQVGRGKTLPRGRRGSSEHHNVVWRVRKVARERGTHLAKGFNRGIIRKARREHLGANAIQRRGPGIAIKRGILKRIPPHWACGPAVAWQSSSRSVWVPGQLHLLLAK